MGIPRGLPLPLRKKENQNKKKTNIFPFNRVVEYIYRLDGYQVGIASVTPINAEAADELELESAIESVRVALQGWRGRFQILVNSERLQLGSYMTYLNNMKSKQDLDVMIDMLEEYQRGIEWEAERLKAVNRFYIVLEAKGKGAAQTLEDAFGRMANDLDEQGLFVHVFKRDQIMRLLYERLNPKTSRNTPLQSGAEEYLLAPSYMKMNLRGEMEIDEVYRSYFAIVNYPTSQPGPRWMKRVLEVDCNKTISFIANPRQQGNLGKTIGKSMDRLERQLDDPSLPKEVLSRKEREYQDAKKMLDEITNDQTQLYDVSVIIEVQGDTKDELKEAENLMQNALSGPRLTARKIVLPGTNRFDPFFATLPILHRSNVSDSYYTWNFTTKGIADIFPFDSGEYQDKTGYLFARNPYSKNLIVIDQYDKNEHDNGHGFTLGLPGSGKTYQEENKVLRQLPLVDYIIMFDPESEYNFQLPGGQPLGKRYDIGSMCTNPLEITTAIVDSDSNTDGKIDHWKALMNHIQKVITLIRFWVKDISPAEIGALEEDLRETYMNAGYHKDMREFPEPPILADLGKVMKEKIKETDSETNPGRARLYQSLNPYLHPEGSFAHLFNGPTTWGFDDKLVIFDLSNITKEAQPAVYFLLTMRSWDFIKECRRRGKRSYWVADECHLMMDIKNIEAAEMLKQINKRGRKYWCSLQLITQNLLDFLGITIGADGSSQTSELTKIGTAIINNSRFVQLYRIGKLDLQQLETLWQFSRREKMLLSASKGKGKGVLIIGNSLRLEFQTFRMPHEEKYIKPKEGTEIDDDLIG